MTDSASIQLPPRRVAVQIRHREPAGYLIRLGERAGDSNSLNTLTGSAFSICYNLPAPYFPSGATSSRVGNWDLAIERTNSLVALARSLFLPALRGDTRLGFCNFRRLQPSTAGKCFSFLSALIHDANQSASRVFKTLFFPPVLSSAPLLHAEQHAARSVGNVRKVVGEIQNVER